MDNGRVYWITGLHNSGKTTLGNALYYRLKKQRDNVIIIDGDLMKEIASGSEKVGYTREDRILRAKRYAKIAKLLADQGQWVVICAIAMFDEVREWNRNNIRGYIEIFLDVPKKILQARERNGRYVEIPYVELPKDPDIVLKNDGMTAVRILVKQLTELTPRNEDDYDRDRAYWNEYYQKAANIKSAPSDFAVAVNEQLEPHSYILELGCGNGRDSLYFLEKGHNIIGIDGSNAAIEFLNENTKEDQNAVFICDDFVKCQTLYLTKYDCIYSRFTLHAITEEQENEMLLNVKNGLTENGLFCIEARTIHDDIYGKGEKIGHNTYIYNEHFRRFIDVNEFREKLLSIGFNIVYLEEKDGFSKTEDSDPVLMRCVANLKSPLL